MDISELENSEDDLLYNNTDINSNATFNESAQVVSIENGTIAPYPDFTQIPFVRGIFVTLFLIECLVGAIGNLMVCLTVYRNKSMHSPVNYYIVNLGICDFLVQAFVLPFKLFELTADAKINFLSSRGCTIVRFVETVLVFSSVLTLVAICAERYYAVVFPVLSRINLKDHRIRRVLIMVWILPCILAAPNIWYPSNAATHYLYSDLGEFSRLTCHDTFTNEFRTRYFIFLFVTMYMIPLIFIVVTCFSITRVLMKKIPAQTRRDPRAISMEHGRRKVAKMVLVIVLSFTVCWTPYFIVSVITQYHNFFENGQFFFTMLSINLLCFTNSTVNPFVYFAMSARFRKGFIMIADSLRRCSNPSRLSTESSISSQRHTSRITSNGQNNIHGNLRVHSNRVLNENLNSLNRDPTSSNVSPGNIKDYLTTKKKRRFHRGRNRTIVLQFHHCERQPCCSKLIRSEVFCKNLDNYNINKQINWQETSRL